jgi:hypothetical protein
MKIFFHLLHHCIAHPLKGILFGRIGTGIFHDWTAQKAWPEERWQVQLALRKDPISMPRLNP